MVCQLLSFEDGMTGNKKEGEEGEKRCKDKRKRGEEKSYEKRLVTFIIVFW